MNNTGVLTHLYDQLKTYKAETGTSARKDGVALLMSSETWIALQIGPVPPIGPIPPEEVLNIAHRLVMGCRVITSPDPPKGDIFVVLPSSHRFLKVTHPTEVQQSPNGVAALDSMGKVHLGVVPSGTYTISGGSGPGATYTFTTDHVSLAKSDVGLQSVGLQGGKQGLYQQAQTTWPQVPSDIYDPAMKTTTWMPGCPDPAPMPNPAKTKYTEEILKEMKVTYEVKGPPKTGLPTWQPTPEELEKFKKEFASPLLGTYVEPSTHTVEPAAISSKIVQWGEFKIGSSYNVPPGSVALPVPPAGSMSYDAETHTTYVHDGQGNKMVPKTQGVQKKVQGKKGKKK